ncbi:MAG TPA: SIS domain-containing protein [Candidatus Binatia bacterium]|nr:SIS domain-containing protein [Candidatus Binatia bacterium]
MSDHDGRGRHAAGAYSRAEILSQPEFWARCMETFERANDAVRLRKDFGECNEWMFIGCGSSYYIALSAAACWSKITGQRARAIPASELLLFPELAAEAAEKPVAVLISRSGSTSETVRAAEILSRSSGVRTVAVTGTPNSPLEKHSQAILSLPPCDEHSTVMTRSFSSMLLGLQYLAASWAADDSLLSALRRLPALAGAALENLNPRIQEFVAGHDFSDYVCLGQGPYYGLACECALKLTEMSISYAQSFHTLEFRHGPKSIVAPDTLVVFLLSEQGYAAEVDVLEEIKSLGGTTLTIANRADGAARAASDLLIEFAFESPELARLAPYVFAGQLAGLYTGLKKNLDPDSPRHLSRVVMLK